MKYTVRDTCTKVYGERYFLQICKIYQSRCRGRSWCPFSFPHATFCFWEYISPEYISKHWEEKCHHQCSMFRALYITEADVLLRELISAFRNNSWISNQTLIVLLAWLSNPKTNHILLPPISIFVLSRIFSFLLFNETCLSLLEPVIQALFDAPGFFLAEANGQNKLKCIAQLLLKPYQTSHFLRRQDVPVPTGSFPLEFYNSCQFWIIVGNVLIKEKWIAIAVSYLLSEQLSTWECWLVLFSK